MGLLKIMLASLGAYGHLYPMMPVALACADAGHEAVIRDRAALSGTAAASRSGLQHGHIR